METTFTECPNCNTPLKGGFLSSVTLIDSQKVNFINAVNDKDIDGYCTKCGGTLYDQAKLKVEQEVQEIKRSIWHQMGFIPVISAQNPLNWDYEVLMMVTGQSTTGTGVLSEFTSSWTDLFGAQSGAYNSKIKAGEQLCFGQLRKQTIDIGGNAVIATDIDYSELGAEKGMIMVCMAGTAVRVKNLEIFSDNRQKAIADLTRLTERLNVLQTL